MNFLKKLFQKKEVTSEISFNQLSSWLVKNVEFSLDTEMIEFKKASISLEAAIKKLSETKVKNEGGKRIVSAVKTNKKAYITALTAFHKKLEEPKNLDYDSIKEYGALSIKSFPS